MREFDRGGAAVVVAHFVSDDLVLSAGRGHDSTLMEHQGRRSSRVSGDTASRSRVALRSGQTKKAGSWLNPKNHERYRIIDLKLIRSIRIGSWWSSGVTV